MVKSEAEEIPESLRRNATVVLTEVCFEYLLYCMFFIHLFYQFSTFMNINFVYDEKQKLLIIQS